MTETTKAKNFFFPPKNTTCTKTFWLFLSDYKVTIDAFYFMLRLAHRADEVSLLAARALISIHEGSDEQINKLQEQIDNPDRAAKELRKYSEVNSRNIMASVVEGFLWYLSNIIQNAIKRRPEMIRSSE